MKCISAPANAVVRLQNRLHRTVFKQTCVTRMQKYHTPRALSVHWFKARRRQVQLSTLRQRGKNLTVTLPREWTPLRWSPGQRVWFQLRGPVVVITAKPTGERGLRRYSSRIGHAHVSLFRTTAEHWGKPRRGLRHKR